MNTEANHDPLLSQLSIAASELSQSSYHADVQAWTADRDSRPEALFITCADPRIDANAITQSKPGTLVVVRNAGNVVPPYTAQAGGEAATIELAIKRFGVGHIIVCGHTHCAIVNAMDNSQSESLPPALCSYVTQANSYVACSKRVQAAPSTQALNLTELHVLSQLDNLETHPSVAEALASGQLQIHGWVYDLDSGHILAYSDEHNCFRALHA